MPIIPQTLLITYFQKRSVLSTIKSLNLPKNGMSARVLSARIIIAYFLLLIVVAHFTMERAIMMPSFWASQKPLVCGGFWND